MLTNRVTHHVHNLVNMLFFNDIGWANHNVFSGGAHQHAVVVASHKDVKHPLAG